VYNKFIMPTVPNAKDYVGKMITEHAIDKDIASFLYMIADNTVSDKSERDAKNELIRNLFAEGFEAHDPSGTMKIGSKVIQQAMWRVMSKVKFLDCQVNGTGKDEDVERLVTEGIMTVADRGGLSSCFRDKGGVFLNLGFYGDGFLFFGKGENDENPVSFRVLRNEDVYYDPFAMGVRGVRPANKMAVIYQFDKDEAYELWPELKDNNIWGKIAGSAEGQDSEDVKAQEDIVEVCWAWNRAQKKYVIFAGVQAFPIDRFEGEEYPFIKNGKAFIPVFQFICQPSAEGFTNYGIGDMVYDLALITRKLLNMEVTHIEENVLPVTLLNAPQAKIDELVEKMAMANEARAKGMKPFVAMEFDARGGAGSVGAQALITQNLFNEWSAIWDRLYRELSRLGINLDDIERGSGITKGQVIAEEQAGNAFVLQMQEYNASETKELVECVIDAIKEFVSVKNKTPLNLLTRLTLPTGKAMKMEKTITMGMLSKELKDSNYFVAADARSGAIPSDLTKMIYEERQLAITPPNSPEYNELYRRMAMRRGLDMQLKSQNGPAAPPQGAAPQSGVAPQGAPPLSVMPPAGIEAQQV
jgi:hypothetical protein